MPNYPGEVLSNGYIVAGQMPDGDWLAVAPANRRELKPWNDGIGLGGNTNSSESSLALNSSRAPDPNTGTENTDELVSLSQDHLAALYARSQGGDLPNHQEVQFVHDNKSLIDSVDTSAASSSYSFAEISSAPTAGNYDKHMVWSSSRNSSTGSWAMFFYDAGLTIWPSDSGNLNTFLVIPVIRIPEPPAPTVYDIPEWSYNAVDACEEQIIAHVNSNPELSFTVSGYLRWDGSSGSSSGIQYDASFSVNNTLYAVYNSLVAAVSSNHGVSLQSSDNFPDCLSTPPPPPPPATLPDDVDSTYYQLTTGCSLPPGTIEVSAVYIVTFVSEFGEEGPPSPPSELISRWDGGDVTLGSLPVSSEPNISHKRIYRAETSGTYLFVDEIPNSQTSYTDSKKTLELGEPLKSMDWDKPDPRMTGLTYIGNGILAGWFDNTLCFCEPYRPHAWPIGYQYGFNAEIVGIAPAGGGVIVVTKSSPWLVTGSFPSAMTQSRLDYHLGGSSRQSVVDMGEYAIYASSEGLIAVAGREATNITKTLLTRDQWRAYQPEQIHAYRWHERYLGLYPGGAFILHKEQGLIHYPVSGIVGGWQDTFTGDVFLFDSSGNVSAWFEGGTIPYRWVSKVFSLPQKASCNTFKVDGEQRRNNPVQLRIYADGKVLYGKRLTNTEALRLPSGRYRDYQVELTGTADILSVQLTFTSSELL